MKIALLYFGETQIYCQVFLLKGFVDLPLALPRKVFMLGQVNMALSPHVFEGGHDIRVYVHNDTPIANGNSRSIRLGGADGENATVRHGTGRGSGSKV